MARKRHTEEQKIGVLKESEAGAKTGELCRKHGMNEATFYKWRAKSATGSPTTTGTEPLLGRGPSRSLSRLESPALPCRQGLSP